MREKLRATFKRIKHYSQQNRFRSLLILLILLSIPLTVWLVMQQTFLRSNAAETTAVIQASTGDISGNAKIVTNQYGTSSVQFGGVSSMPFGWDYNMTKRCVRTLELGIENSFQDATDCDSSGNYWMIANESEKSSLTSCPGPLSHSFPFNKPESPLSFEWLPHIDEQGNQNLIARLKTDFINKTHACGDGYYTWTTIHPSGPFPLAHKTVLDIMMAYTDVVKNGHSRIIIGWTVANGNGQAYEMEFDVASTNIFYNRATSDPIVVKFDFDKNNARHFFEINSQVLNKMGSGLPALTIPEGQFTNIHLDLYKVLEWMIGSNYIPPTPANTPYKTTGFYFGSEVRQETAANSIMADVQITNVRVSDIR